MWRRLCRRATCQSRQQKAEVVSLINLKLQPFWSTWTLLLYFVCLILFVCLFDFVWLLLFVCLFDFVWLLLFVCLFDFVWLILFVCLFDFVWLILFVCLVDFVCLILLVCLVDFVCLFVGGYWLIVFFPPQHFAVAAAVSVALESGLMHNTQPSWATKLHNGPRGIAPWQDVPVDLLWPGCGAKI